MSPRQNTSAYLQLTGIFEKYYYLKRTRSVLDWDTAVLLPAGSTEIRGQQVAALQGVMQQLLTSKKLYGLFDQVQQEYEQLTHWQRANVREMNQLFRINTALPSKLQHRLINQSVNTERAWRLAREKKDFGVFSVPLEKLLTLIREKAACMAEAFELAPYEALMQEYDWGSREQATDRFFASLETDLPPLLSRVFRQHGERKTQIGGLKLKVKNQETLCKRLLLDMGFDFNTGRLDRSIHPFTEGGYQDIRITTSYDKMNVCTTVMGAMHEFGHAQYDMNLPVKWHTQPVGRDRGMAIHESMSLFYEMALGRNPAMVQYLKTVYQEHNWEFDENEIYTELLHCQPHCIRIHADEATYLPHIMLRYSMEKALLNGSLKVADIPDCWNQQMRELIGIEPENILEGCLQDIHWSMGLIGYFPSYAYGAVNAANLYNRMQRDGITIPPAFNREFFNSASNWLTEGISSQGSFPTQPHLVASLGLADVSNYLNYIETKYLH